MTRTSKLKLAALLSLPLITNCGPSDSVVPSTVSSSQQHQNIERQLKSFGQQCGPIGKLMVNVEKVASLPSTTRLTNIAQRYVRNSINLNGTSEREAFGAAFQTFKEEHFDLLNKTVTRRRSCLGKIANIPGEFDRFVGVQGKSNGGMKAFAYSMAKNIGNKKYIFTISSKALQNFDSMAVYQFEKPTIEDVTSLNEVVRITDRQLVSELTDPSQQIETSLLQKISNARTALISKDEWTKERLATRDYYDENSSWVIYSGELTLDNDLKTAVTLVSWEEFDDNSYSFFLKGSADSQLKLQSQTDLIDYIVYDN